jgi:hypothetical protein
LREAELIIGGEVEPRARRERAQPIASGESGEIGGISLEQ